MVAPARRTKQKLTLKVVFINPKPQAAFIRQSAKKQRSFPL